MPDADERLVPRAWKAAPRAEAQQPPPVVRRLSLKRRIGRGLSRGLLAVLLGSVALVLMLRFVPPPVSALMMENRVRSWFEEGPYQPQYTWVSFEQIASAAGLAVIAAEDQNFPEHSGFDWAAIEKAIDQNERGRRVRGASTISQQTAKNLFLWSARSWLRKGAEAYFTTLLELFWSKQRILEVYLNIVEFGDGVYGVEAAAQRYFHKPAARLSASEAALLAAVLPNPHRFKVDAPSAYVRSRQAWIARQMKQLGGPGLLKSL